MAHLALGIHDDALEFSMRPQKLSSQGTAYPSRLFDEIPEQSTIWTVQGEFRRLLEAQEDVEHLQLPHNDDSRV